MASNGKRTSDRTKRKKTSTTRARSTAKKTTKEEMLKEEALYHELTLIGFFALMLFLFICNFGILGPVGKFFSDILFGIFGLTAYIAPVFIFFVAAFWYANAGSFSAIRKVFASVLLFLSAGVICELLTKRLPGMDGYSLVKIFTECKKAHNGGGIIAGSLAYLLYHYLETVGTIFVVLVCTVAGIILLTEKSLLEGMKNGGELLREKGREESARRKEYAQIRKMEQAELRAQREEERRVRDEERRLREEEIENEKILRMEKKVSGVMMDTSLKPKEKVKRRDDIHEITYEGQEELSDGEIPVYRPTKTQEILPVTNTIVAQAPETTQISNVSESEKIQEAFEPVITRAVPKVEQEDVLSSHIRVHKDGVTDTAGQAAETSSEVNVTRHRPVASAPAKSEADKRDEMTGMSQEISATEKRQPSVYTFPPLSRLQKGVAQSGDSTQELKETAMRLQQTLQTFGVKVTVTDISQGPSVTRYELQPEQGVKVSKIVGLSDDIKLNLAATDIRIEAPIPGKAAIGIEVPNKENKMVALRDLLESDEFKAFPSNLAFAVGKDIGGKTVVADIAKMPHMLIAGSTGSGKSVCINTLIMSILYKASPDDVKLIMVDPKVVELSVYNGIPHLLIPVVTDPKKASAALHWAVSEMDDRYRKFAQYNVRDLKGYNQKVESERESGKEDAPSKLPQIVIIVDELADLMMVCPGEVEESICRLAQLARACGIHLIIATQRPSVDVITGLIKANMPSRVAFAVSSGVDSRTILDMVGAEKLLGKGDMLFYPQGYSKPARIQGAFVSDKEVYDVVDFLKNQMLGNTYASDIEEKIQNMDSSSGSGTASGGGGDDRDEHFAEAGKFIIEKDKASIGMLQRVFKIGFNRAARIMDQLCEYGVVSEEEGTKPRKVLMSMEQFEQLLEEI